MLNLNIQTKEFFEKFESIEKYDELPFTQELWRKAFHLTSLSIPIIYTFVTREFALFVLSIVTSIAIIIDLLIKRGNIIRDIIFKIFGKLFRKYEKNGFVFNGATWILISAFINILLFPKVFTVVSFYVLVISDATSALIGKRFGKTRFLNKSFEGSCAFCLSGAIVVSLFGYFIGAPSLFFIFAILGVLLATIVEASSASLHLDDNLGIPFAISLTLLIGSFIAQNFNQNFLDLLK
ncbi:MAG: diacylglycerol/polyprenol kinase family protein [Candidatus Kapaibacteriales bacterium]